MALIKTKTVKGIECDYWKITSWTSSTKFDTTDVLLALFPSNAVRDANMNNFQGRETVTVEGTDKLIADLYVAVKALEEMEDEVNTNFFADAVSDEI